MGFYKETRTTYRSCRPTGNCKEETELDCTVYNGEDLICTDIKKGTKLTKIIEKLSVFICNILGILPLKADLVNGKVPISQLPPFSSLNKSVITLPNFLSFPTVGEADVIYIAKLPKNIQYIWNGTIYEKISSNINSSDDVNQGVVNLYMTDVEKIKLNGLNNFDNSGNILALNNKVDKVLGQGLISDVEKARLTTVVNYDNSSNISALNNKVDKVSGKSLVLDSEIIRLAGLNNFDPTPINNQLANKADLVGGLVPSNQLPSFVDDVIEVANFASLPATGEIGKIYIAISPKNLQYRWSGSSYIAITNGLIASTDDVPEGNNLYFTIPRFLQNLTFANIISGLGFTPENVANKSNTLTPSTTLYPNNNAVINAISNANLPVSSTQSGIVNNVSLQELGGVDKNINSVRVGRGSGNVNSNTSIGLGALLTNTTGGANTALGLNALNKNTTGGANVASGFTSLSANTTGFGNTAIGVASLIKNTIGNSNTTIGRGAGGEITTGSNNTYIGEGTTLGNTSDTIVLSAGTTNRIIVDPNGKTNLLGALTVSGNITATTNTGTPNEVVRNSDIVGLTTTDATPTTKGIVKLAGDLSGTADLPTVPNKVDKVSGKSLILDSEITRLAGVTNFDNSGNVTALNLKENLSNKSTDVETDKLSTIKYPSTKAFVDWINPRFQTALTSGASIKTIEGQSILGSGNIDLTKADVGLANVDNTADIAKPISTLTQTALNTKENLSNKSSTLIASTILYPNNDAVISGLATKQNIITPQNVTAGSTKIILAGMPTGASLQPFSINVNEANFAVPQANVVDLTASLASKENTIVAGTTAQYRRGDNTWQTLDKNAVGLNLVDNTVDINKPISTATQNSLNNKQNVLQFEQSSSNILTVVTSSISWCKLFTTSSANFLGAIVNFNILSGTSVDSGQINIQGAFYDMSDPSFFPFVEVTHQTYSARLIKIIVIKESEKLAVYAQINAADTVVTLRWNVNSVDTSININNVIANPANEIGVFTLPNFLYVKANNRGYVQKLNGDIDITGKLTSPSPNLTGIPTAPTAPIGTNTTQIATTAFVTNADAGNVKLIGDQNIIGKKTFTNSSNDISINVNNFGVNSGVLISNTANGTGLGIINQVNGSGLICENNNSGNGIVSNGNVSSTGFVFAGQNSGLKTFTVNKEGDTVVAKLNVNQILNLANVPIFSSALLASSSSLLVGDVYQVNGVLMIIQPK